MMKESVRLVVVLTLICLVSAFLVSLADYITKEPIAKAVIKQKQDAVFAVLPEGAANMVEKEIVIRADDGTSTTNTYWQTDKGLAMLRTAPNGYAGKIELMLGFTTDGNFWSYQVISQKETPGLGANITGSFIDNVKNRSASETEWKVVKDGGDIVPITAATISSRAVCGAIEKGVEIYNAILAGGSN